MTLKRSRKEEEGTDAEDSMVDCLMLLSKIGQSPSPKFGRVFECKTCKKQFHSFQALGGHVASHKKLKLMACDFLHRSRLNFSKPKKHECPICGAEFKMGQALGGHMRRHRVAAPDEGVAATPAAVDRGGENRMVAVLKRSNSKRVFGLDLNLMPFEIDLNLKLEMKSAPVTHFSD